MYNDLRFIMQDHVIEMIHMGNHDIPICVWRGIVYEKNPADLEYQTMSIFVREQLFNGEVINGYTLKTAPIFIPCSISGYRPGIAAEPEDGFSIAEALYHGYVVVTAATRGNGMKSPAGCNIGMAPGCLVDMKAVVRYLRYNRETVPGNVDRIITNGTSAGGAISALMAATGNHPDYLPYLNEVGAADAGDDVFAASCYGPVTDLDNADMAYEWEFSGQRKYYTKKIVSKNEKIRVYHEMNDKQMELSIKLKIMFPDHINKLELKDSEGSLLTLDKDGNGSFKDYICAQVIKSAQKELEKGKDLTGYSWLNIEGDKVTGMNFSLFTEYRSRMKSTPAFDSLLLDTPENCLFSSKNYPARHFTCFSYENAVADVEMAEERQIKLMNPMYYIGDPESKVSQFVRIRQGTIDHNLSLAITAELSLMFEMNGSEVDYFLPWDIPHAGDYDLEELFNWIDSIQ